MSTKDPSVESLITESFNESLQAKRQTLDTLKEPIHKAIQACIECAKKNGTIYWAGNGGSAADSQHMAAELVGRFKKERRAIKSVALTVNSSILTAIGNDYTYDYVFERQLEAFAAPGDVLIAISTSGNSGNILKAAALARKHGMTVIGLTGKTGGKLVEHADILLNVPSANTARIQESHLLIEHILCEAVEMAF